jgi:hypothetical protein
MFYFTYLQTVIELFKVSQRVEGGCCALIGVDSVIEPVTWWKSPRFRFQCSEPSERLDRVVLRPMPILVVCMGINREM